MVDYNFTLPQQQYIQPPDLLKNYLQLQQAQANALQMQQVKRTQEQQNALAELMKGGGDFTSPEFRQKALATGGAAAVPYLSALATMSGEDIKRKAEEARAGRYNEQAQSSQLDRQLKLGQHFRDQLPGILESADPAAAYSKWQPAAEAAGISAPKEYPGKEAVTGLMMKADDAIKAAQSKLQVVAGPGGVPLFANTQTGTFQAGTETPPTGAAPAAPGNAYANRTAAIEGTAPNPNSSATGKYQFVNGTFVDTARKAFPALANKSPEEILALRGTKLPDGTQIEDVLEQRLRANNTAALSNAGIQPTPGNTYLAHFLGSGGATKLLTADPNTPVSQILDPKAIAANESILAGKTAGQVASWANGKYSGVNAGPPMMSMGQQFRPEGSVPGGANALATMAQPGMAPVVANVLAQQMQPAAQTPMAAPQMNNLSPFQQAQQTANARALEQKAAEERQKSQITQEQALPEAKAKETAAREVNYEKATTGVQSALSEIDEQIRLVKELRAHEGLGRITGSVAGATPNASQKATNAQALLDTIKEKGKLTALLQLKEQGGTLGQVSNAEGEGLKQSIAPMGQRQDTETFGKRLDAYAVKLEAAKARLKGAYEDTYSYRNAKVPDNGFSVTDPTGTVHTFPSAEAADKFKRAAGL